MSGARGAGAADEGKRGPVRGGGSRPSPPLQPPAAVRAAHHAASSCAVTWIADILRCTLSSSVVETAAIMSAATALLRITIAGAMRSAPSSADRTGADAQNRASSSALRKRRRASMPAILPGQTPAAQAPAATRGRASEGGGRRGRRAAPGQSCGRRLAGGGDLPADGGDAGAHATPGLAAAAPCAGRAQLAAGRERMRDGGAQREPAPACRPPPRRARGRPHEGPSVGVEVGGCRAGRGSGGERGFAYCARETRLLPPGAHSCSPDPPVVFEWRTEASRLASGRRVVGSPRREEDRSQCGGRLPRRRRRRFD